MMKMGERECLSLPEGEFSDLVLVSLAASSASGSIDNKYDRYVYRISHSA